MKKMLLRTVITLLVLQALYLVSPSVAQAADMSCPPHKSVTIDVKPGDSVTKINLSSKGLLPVAVLSTEDFVASLFMPERIHLSDANSTMGCEGAEPVRWAYTDVNGDGLVDIVFFFRTEDLELTASTTAVMLMGHGTYGSMSLHIMGEESVTVKP